MPTRHYLRYFCVPEVHFTGLVDDAKHVPISVLSVRQDVLADVSSATRLNTRFRS